MCDTRHPDHPERGGAGRPANHRFTARPEAGRLARAAAGALLAVLLSSQAAFADPNLLRGPQRKGAAARPGAVADPSASGIGWIAQQPVRFYRQFIGPHLGRPCPMHPSCSSYALQAIATHGALVGTVMTFDRLQHESDEAGYAPLVVKGGAIRVFDPVENNDFWWRGGAAKPAATAAPFQQRADRGD